MVWIKKLAKDTHVLPNKTKIQQNIKLYFCPRKSVFPNMCLATVEIFLIKTRQIHVYIVFTNTQNVLLLQEQNSI